ncbi:LamG-like jellyroll fold domain-containing protein [Aestuariivivens insulae]|uniref:LamG-like jellyroll fold domain-containing protein n=1 Tax=Aestuariivivens insulae TaxID=1621988 RepID=UPI001F581A97|nr:LamG-like jellyroll fold domain-containing protein [Aestuariivivens insulae]
MKTKLLLVLALFTGTIVFGQTIEAKYEFGTNGDLTDASGNGRTLTKMGSALKTFVTDNDSNVESAFDAQDATGEYLVATGYKGIAGNGARTVAAWINLRAGTNRRTIASWGVNASGQMFNVMIEVGKIRVEGGTSSLLSAGTVPNSSWHHVAVTFDPNDNGGQLSSCKMYIDGVLQVEGSNYNGTTVLNTDTATNDVRIGEAVYGTGHFYRGELNDVVIYSGALTNTEIATLAGVTVTAPVANFSVSNTSPSEGEMVEFTDASTGDAATSWTWDFGSADAVGDRTAQNPVVSYPTAGAYTVTLTASNAGGSDDEVKTDYITVSAGSGTGDLQAHYNFDGNTNDASSYGRNLTVTGSFVPSYEADANANASSALTTSGVYADHLITGYPGIGAGNARSVTAWFKTTGTGREPIVSCGIDAPGKMFNVMIDNGVPRIEGGTSSLKTSDTGLNDGTWHHIAVTFDPNDGDKLANCKIYVDGALSTNEADAGTSYNSETVVINTDITTNFLKVASTVYSTYAFDGALDDVRMYSNALTAGEVTSVYNRQTLSVKGNVEVSTISVYPTRISRLLNVKAKTNNALGVEVYNMLGRLVIEKVINQNETALDVSALATGLYIVKVTSGVQASTVKVIKQ